MIGTSDTSRRVTCGALSLLSNTHKIPLFLAVALILTLFVPPNGLLTHNEEQYLQSSILFVSEAEQRDTSAILTYMSHTFVFSGLTSAFIVAVDYEWTQVLGRILTIILLSASLMLLFHSLCMSVFEASLVLFSFYFLGQDILGGEWIFGGYEPKVLSYPFVLAALALSIQRKSVATGLYVIATYLHFLVGGFWLVANAITAVWSGQSFGRILRSIVYYFIICSPMIALVVLSNFDFVSPIQDGDRLEARYIYKYIAYPHHTAPFADLRQFSAWAPGISLLVGMFIVNCMLLRDSTNGEIQLARLNFVVLGWLIIAIPITLVDRQGYLAPFVLFRPSSLALLIFLMQLILRFRRLCRPTEFFTISGTILVFFWAVPLTIIAEARGIYKHAEIAGSRVALVEYIDTHTDPSDVFLVDSTTSDEMLWFERETGRMAYVFDKFKPSSSDMMIEWSNRRAARDRIFEGICIPIADVTIKYLVTAHRQDVECGDLVFESDHFRLYRATLGESGR